MDSLIPLLLLALLYLVPELLKRRKKPKEYEYPDIPDKRTQPTEINPVKSNPKPTIVVTDFAAETSNTQAIPQKPIIAMPAPATIPQSAEPVSPWQGKLSPQIVQNGLIFAEIIQPPRAYRPMWRRHK